MRKGRSIIGLNVLSQTDATDFGKVRDLIFDHETDELLALLISERDLFGLIDAQIVPWSEVRSIGPNAIMVASGTSKIKAGDYPRVKEIMNRETALSGTRIITTDGQEIGTLADMYIEDETGRIVGYEVSGGFFSDTMSGKRFMPAIPDMPIGKGVAVVPAEVATEFEAQKQDGPGGVAGVVQTAGEKIAEAYGSAATTVNGAVSSTAGKVSETYDATKGKVSDSYANIVNATVSKQKEFVVGKVAGQDVLIPNQAAAEASSLKAGAVETPAPELTSPEALPATGLAALGQGEFETVSAVAPIENPSRPITETAINETTLPSEATSFNSSGSEILVRQGEVITQEQANRAESLGLLRQLVLAAGGGSASNAFAAGREKLNEAVASGPEATRGLSASVQETAEAAAVGKPAGREVTARDGSTIIAPGMIITQDVIQRARIEGKEKEVLASAGLGAAQQGVDTVKEGASNLWDTIKQKASELTDAAHEKKAEYDAHGEQAKINNALGRPTTRVILDREDNVILNTGDIITHKAVETSRQAGVLDILLSSVYSAEPEITPEMMRVQSAGEASLPGQAQPTGGPITATVAPDSDSSSSPSQDQPSQGALHQGTTQHQG
jgi:uncharacterized protein YrrD